jgi:N-acetylmuramoyl-L-alanine amidase
MYTGRKTRMNRLWPAFVPWMVLAGSAYGQVRTAEVVYTPHGTTAQAAFRVGDECFVPANSLDGWGWKVHHNATDIAIDLDGRTIHESTRSLAGQTVIAIRKTVTDMGGATEWSHGADSLDIYSEMSLVSVKGLSLHVKAPLAFKSSPFYLNPGRTVIDLDGTRLAPGTTLDLSSGAKVSQYRPNTVRIVLPTNFVPLIPQEVQGECSAINWAITRDSEAIAQNNEPRPDVVATKVEPIHGREVTPLPSVTPVSPPVIATVQTPPPFASLGVVVNSENETTTDLTIQAPGFTGQAMVQRPDMDTLQVLLPNVTGSLTAGTSIGSVAVNSVDTSAAANGTIVTFHLARAMGTEVTSGTGTVTVVLLKPRVGNGRLAGKVIVIDPGHGGHDSGTRTNGINEKDLTLSIGAQLAEKLARAGANVIVTRRTDVFIPLTERSAISNRNHADLFISCHINSSAGEKSSQSGTIVFYHGSNQVSNILAQCIQGEIKQANRLPVIGAWSDTKIYHSGFSVLRGTSAPAVLIEMGFLNNDHDRPILQTADFQDAVTTAIVRGVRVYLGDMKPNE